MLRNTTFRSIGGEKLFVTQQHFYGARFNQISEDFSHLIRVVKQHRQVESSLGGENKSAVRSPKSDSLNPFPLAAQKQIETLSGALAKGGGGKVDSRRANWLT
jgi:hypothetical protein